MCLGGFLLKWGIFIEDVKEVWTNLFVDVVYSWKPEIEIEEAKC